jgi:6-hydroxy-3-succinoylpyridine 3-monooxygenase
MYRDASRGALDHLVLVSNDSDLAPTLQMIREDFPHIKVGLIFPTLSHKGGARQSGQLSEYAHWVRKSLNVDELAACQLPEKVQNRKNKTIRKPEGW